MGNRIESDIKKIGKLYLSNLETEIPVHIPDSTKCKPRFVCDHDSLNWHLFPEDVKLAESCSTIISEKQKGIIEDHLIKNIGKHSNNSIEDVRGIPSRCSQWVQGTGYEDSIYLFNYIHLKCKNFCYDLMFVRFFKTEDKINCILNCFQLEIYQDKEPKDKQYPNTGEDWGANEGDTINSAIYFNFPCDFNEPPEHIAEQLVSFIKNYENKRILPCNGNN